LNRILFSFVFFRVYSRLKLNQVQE